MQTQSVIGCILALQFSKAYVYNAYIYNIIYYIIYVTSFSKLQMCDCLSYAIQ